MSYQSNFGLRGPYRLYSYPGATIDVRSTNPLADYARVTDPARAVEIAKVEPAPRMFSAGTADLPPFTASGLPPEQLLQLPYGMRHAVAAESEMTKVYAMFEDAAANPDRVIAHPALEDAYHRVQEWLEKTDTRTEAEKAQESADHELLMQSWGMRDRGTFLGSEVTP